MDFIFKPLWGVQLEGPNASLKEAKRIINGAVRSEFSYNVFLYGDIYVLGTSKWDKYENASDVYAAALTEFEVIQGCLAIAAPVVRPLELGTVYDLRTPGNANLWRQSGMTIYASGAEVADPKEFADLMKKAEISDEAREAMSTLVSAPSWFQIYRSYESLKSFWGSETKMMAALPGKAKSLELLRRTANVHRHFKSVEPKIPMPYTEAIKLIDEVMRAGIENVSLPAYDGPKTITMRTTDYHIPADAPTHLNKLTLS